MRTQAAKKVATTTAVSDRSSLVRLTSNDAIGMGIHRERVILDAGKLSQRTYTFAGQERDVIAGPVVRPNRLDFVHVQIPVGAAHCTPRARRRRRFRVGSV